MNLPSLISFAIYDGIPPKKEGEDPTVFWYWPTETPIDSQLNQVGLYLTFTGFCRDFRSSKDCEYMQTDSSITCFENIGEDVCIAACFQTTDVTYCRILLLLIRAFKSACLMFYPPPVRTKTGDVDNISNLIQDIKDYLVFFKYIPFFNSFPPNLDLWIKCEEAIANMKVRFPTIKSVAFTYKDYIVHNSMNPDDLFSLYISCKAKIEILMGFSIPENQRPKNQPVWLVGLSSKNLLFSPSINLSDSSTGSPIIISYNDLIVFIIFSTQINKKMQDEIPQLKTILEPILPNIERECIRMTSLDSQKASTVTSTAKPPSSKPVNLSSKNSSDNNFLANISLSGTNSMLFSNEIKQKRHIAGSTYLFSKDPMSPQNSLIYNSNSNQKTAVSSSSLHVQQLVQEEQHQKQQFLFKPKPNKQKNTNQQQPIVLYKDNGFTKFIQKQFVQSSSSFSEKFNDQYSDEKMINFLSGNDNQYVRFCGLNDSGTYTYMEKIGKDAIFLDGLKDNASNPYTNSNLGDATSDYLKFLKESCL